MDDFGQLVKHRRKLKGISTRELSKQVGMSSAYISQLERGLVKRPVHEVAKRIADILDIQESVLDYFGYVPPEVEQQWEERDIRDLEHREQLETAYISNLTEQIKSMSLESLEAVSFIINHKMDVAWKIYEISRSQTHQSMLTVEEFVDFLHRKYVVVE